MLSMINPKAKAVIAIAGIAVVLIGAGLWYDGKRKDANLAASAGVGYEQSEPTRPLRLSVITDSDTSWPKLLAYGRGWYLNSEQTPGTGYVAGGSTSFTDKVAGATRTAPDVIVIAGGSNDEFDSAAVPEQASRLYLDLMRLNPGAQILVVGPIVTSTNRAPNVRAVNDAVRSAAEGAGLQFIDAQDWLSAPGLVEVSGQPTEEGDRVIAESIAAALPGLPDEVPA